MATNTMVDGASVRFYNFKPARRTPDGGPIVMKGWYDVQLGEHIIIVGVSLYLNKEEWQLGLPCKQRVFNGKTEYVPTVKLSTAARASILRRMVAFYQGQQELAEQPTTAVEGSSVAAKAPEPATGPSGPSAEQKTASRVIAALEAKRRIPVSKETANAAKPKPKPRKVQRPAAE